ncbi:ricin-type beta-trefoil lectin domain protein [Streptomyces sp. NPDC101225]|uniref:ricin-type beta-trefoil lectin domain protein n=1 Tax=Streptomyces sp. NPDC101225 TaxID=3366135 RepID=UPI003824476B
MDDAPSSIPPMFGRAFDATDERFVGASKKCSGRDFAHYPVGELLDRHWEPVFSYASLCAESARTAGVLASAAFTRLFDESLRQTGPTVAWRPQLLVTVLRIAAEWQADHRRRLLCPELREATDFRNHAGTLCRPTGQRRLLAEAFERLPELGRCLVWHTEVEGEPLAVPAELLGLADEEASVELARAGEQLRERFLGVHRAWAPEKECRHFNRMLDVTYRRGGMDIDADLRRHLERCSHCRFAAHELERFNGPLAVPLAEAVLGWAAVGYVESRPGRGRPTADVAPMPETGTVPRVPGDSTGSGGAGHGSRAMARRASRRKRNRRALVVTVATTSALALGPLVVWSLTTGAQEGEGTSDVPTSSPSTVPGATPSWVGAGDGAGAIEEGQLLNAATGLCLGVERKPVSGAEVGMTDCGSAASQRWSYGSDGLLRDANAPGLCLDSSLAYLVRLASCAGGAKAGSGNMRYDFTRQGALLPRSHPDLALAPAAAKGRSDLVLKLQDDGDEQRWTFDDSEPSLQMKAVGWDSASRTPSTAPTGSGRSASAAASATARPTQAAVTPSATSTSSTTGPAECSAYYSCYDMGGYGGWSRHGRGGRGGNR